MKLLCCDECQDVIFSKIPLEVGTCSCGNIMGGYLGDGKQFVVMRRNKLSCRVVGVDNCVRAGMLERGDAWIQEPGKDSGKNVKEMVYPKGLKEKYGV